MASRPSKSKIECIAASLGYLFPAVEVAAHFRTQDLLNNLDFLNMEGFGTILTKYQESNVSFILFLGIYFFMVRPKFFPTRIFLRFNYAQSLLIYMITILLISVHDFIPDPIKISFIGFLFSNFALLGVIGMTSYSMFLTWSGHFAKIPIISGAAKIHTQLPAD